MGRRILSFLIAIATLVSTLRAAVADSLLLESYVGARPPDADRIAVLVHAVFERRGFVVDIPTLTRLLQEHAYRPGLVNPKFEDVLRNTSRTAENDYTGRRFKKAVKDLARLIGLMRQNALVLTHDPKNRDLALRAMVFYALACGRLATAKDATASDAELYGRLRDETMAEVIRTFPSKIIKATDFGSEAEDLYVAIRDELNKSGRGGLSISVSDLDAVIYINEVVHGTAKVDVGDLLPGVYRVLLLMSNGESRVYDIEVTAKQVSHLAIDWDIDSLLRVETWVGLSYRDEKEHAREARIMRQLSQKRTSADIAATYTVTHVHHHPAVIATSYAVSSGKLLQSGRVELNGTIADETALDHLVDYIKGHTEVEGVTPIEHPEYTPPPDPEPAAPDPPPDPPAPTVAVPATPTNHPDAADLPTARTWPKWSAASGAVVMFALGGYSLYRNYEPCGFGVKPENCRYYYRRAASIGYVSIGIGAALGALATYWFVRDAHRSSTTVTIAPSRAGAVIGWGTGF